MSIRNAFIHNLPLEEQVALFVEHGYILKDGEPIPFENIEWGIISTGGGNIRNMNLEVINGIGTRYLEEYPVLGFANFNGNDFAGVYRGGKIVWIATILFENVIPSEEGSLSSTNDLTINFNPLDSISQTPWFLEIVSGDQK